MQDTDFACDSITGISIARMGIIIENYKEWLEQTTESWVVNLGMKTYLNYYLG